MKGKNHALPGKVPHQGKEVKKATKEQRNRRSSPKDVLWTRAETRMAWHARRRKGQKKKSGGIKEKAREEKDFSRAHLSRPEDGG